MTCLPAPTRQRPETHLTREQLAEYWYADLNRFSEGMGDKYRRNGVLFPRSRFDLIIHYTNMDKESKNV